MHIYIYICIYIYIYIFIYIYIHIYGISENIKLVTQISNSALSHLNLKKTGLK